MHRYLLFLLLIVSAPKAESGDPIIIDLWSASPPGPDREIGEEQDVTKSKDRPVAGKRVVRLGNVSTPQLHVYQPDENKRNGSCVLICPGGGFNILAWDLEGTEVAKWFNTIGVTAAVLKYRVPTRGIDPKWLLPVQDAQRAISIVRSRAREWKIESQRVGIMGFSAGGYTAAHTALAKKRLYKPVDDADKESCEPNAAMLIYAAYLSSDDNTKLSDELRVTEKSPPMFLVHAFDDRIPAEGAMLLTLAMKKAKVSSELHVYDTGGHGYGMRPVKELPVTFWPQRCEDWLRRISWLKTQ